MVRRPRIFPEWDPSQRLIDVGRAAVLGRLVDRYCGYCGRASYSAGTWESQEARLRVELGHSDHSPVDGWPTVDVADLSRNSVQHECEVRGRTRPDALETGAGGLVSQRSTLAIGHSGCARAAVKEIQSALEGGAPYAISRPERVLWSQVPRRYRITGGANDGERLMTCRPRR